MIRFATAAAATFACVLGAPAIAQQADPEDSLPAGPPETVFDGDFVSVGVGVGYSSTYSGSDEYSISVLPIIQGSLGGIGISPRRGGLALDFIPDPDNGVSFSAGPKISLNSDRSDIDGIKDEVVAAYGELDTAVEIGPSVGVRIPGVIHGFDSLSFNVDAGWDVAGAHRGMSISPNLTYFTPLSRSTALSFSLSANHIDDDYAAYYYSVPPANSSLPAADVLPGFEADGGFESIGANSLLVVDLDGDVTDGGLSLIGIGGYSRLLNDAKRSPFTSIRGDDDQYFIALGIGYTF